jgi:hypothetical protein
MNTSCLYVGIDLHELESGCTIDTYTHTRGDGYEKRPRLLVQYSYGDVRVYIVQVNKKFTWPMRVDVYSPYTCNFDYIMYPPKYWLKCFFSCCCSSSNSSFTVSQAKLALIILPQFYKECNSNTVTYFSILSLTNYINKKVSIFIIWNKYHYL